MRGIDPDPRLDPGTARRVSSVAALIGATWFLFKASTRRSLGRAVFDVLGAVVAIVFAIGAWEKRRW